MSELWRVARFGAVGVAGTVINLGVFTAAHAAGLPVTVASVAAFLVAVAHNLALHEVLTFRTGRATGSGRGLRFLAVSTCTLGLNVAVLHVALELGAAPAVAQLSGIVAAFPVNYLASRALVFTPARVRAPAAA
jgi:dolichol-phosphate mannosyltransferase